MSKKRDSYRKYLQSPEWKRRRQKAIDAANYTCQRCGQGQEEHNPLEVHHRSYENFGNETEKDLIVVCKNCHQWIESMKVIMDNRTWEYRNAVVPAEVAVDMELDELFERWSDALSKRT